MYSVEPNHPPPFITEPGQTDWLLVSTGIFLILAVIGVGLVYFRLHALPEQMAHRGQKVQFEIVAVLALLALFTHNHAFWIAALLLALVPMPDFVTPLGSMAQSLSRMADRDAAPAGTPRAVPDPAAPVAEAEPPSAEVQSREQRSA